MIMNAAFRSIRNDSTHMAAHADAIGRLLTNRADADGDTLYLARELEQVSAETLDVLRFPLMGRQTIPFVNELQPGAESWSYDIYDVFSKAQWITNWSTPIEGAGGKKRRVTLTSRHFQAGYQYTVQDLERAAFARNRAESPAGVRALDVEVARAARIAHEQFLDSLVWNGDASRNIPSFPNMWPTFGATIAAFSAIVTGPAGSEVQKPYLYPTHKLFASGTYSGTGPNVVEALNQLCLAVQKNTGGAVVANRLLLPLGFKDKMIQPYSNSILDGKTIESVFLQNQPANGVKQIDYVYNLDSASATSNSPGGRAIAYFSAPQTIKFVLAYDFKEMPVQIKNLAYHVPTYAQVLGPVSQRPLQMAIMDLDNESGA
jgi:hypothetical protein